MLLSWVAFSLPVSGQIIIWIIIGGLAGAIAKFLMPGKDPGGFIVTILLGIAGAFVGTNSSLVAPVTIGEGAYVGAGSVITKAVDATQYTQVADVRARADASTAGRHARHRQEGYGPASARR